MAKARIIFVNRVYWPSQAATAQLLTDLAEGLAALDGIVSAGGIAQPQPGPLDPGRVRTNFVVFRVERSRAEFLAGLRARNVLMVEYPHGQVRAVTHHGVTPADIATILVAVSAVLRETNGTTAGTH